MKKLSVLFSFIFLWTVLASTEHCLEFSQADSHHDQEACHQCIVFKITQKENVSNSSDVDLKANLVYVETSSLESFNFYYFQAVLNVTGRGPPKLS